MAEKRSEEDSAEILEQHATAKSQGLLREYWEFLRYHRKWYLIPIVLALTALGAGVFLGGSSIAPFIYTIF